MKVTVGKTNKKRVIKYLIVLVISLLLLMIPYFLILFLFAETLDFIIIGIFLILIIALIFIIFIIPGLVLMDFMWEVDEYYFRFVSFEKILDKTKLFYSRLLKNKSSQFQTSLRMSQIDFIQVTYYQNSLYPTRYLYGGSGYKIIFKFHMLDGSQYLFENFVGSDKENFFAGIQFMKNYGIQFVDKYKILDAYKTDENMQYYLARVEKGKKHD